MKYRAGDLKERVTLVKVTHTTNADHEKVATDTFVSEVWAKVVDQSAREVMRAERVDMEKRVMVVIRHRGDITNNHVVIHRGRRLNVHSPIDVDGLGQFTELVCTEDTDVEHEE